MQNEPNVKRKKEEFNKVSGPLPNQQSSNIDEQQTKVNEILRQLFISDQTSVSRWLKCSFIVTPNKDQEKDKFSPNWKERSVHLGILFSAYHVLLCSRKIFVNYKTTDFKTET